MSEVRGTHGIHTLSENCKYIKGDVMNFTLMFQDNMVGVGSGFSYNRALLWMKITSYDGP